MKWDLQRKQNTSDWFKAVSISITPIQAFTRRAAEDALSSFQTNVFTFRRRLSARTAILGTYLPENSSSMTLLTTNLSRRKTRLTVRQISISELWAIRSIRFPYRCPIGKQY